VNSSSQPEAWKLLADIERRHRAAMARHDEAFRQLPSSHENLRSPAGSQAWRQYCAAVRELDEATVQLERLVWQVSQGAGT
jgi:hypothetical protein